MPLVVRTSRGLRSATPAISRSRSTHGPAQLTTMRGAHRVHLAREEVAHLHAVEPAGARHERLDLAVVVDAGAVAGGREDVLQAEPLREEQEVVEVVAGAPQVLGPHVRLHRERGPGPQHAVALVVLPGVSRS